MDFYNNVAAVASVLLFAKLVTHRNRKAHKTSSRTLLAIVHTAAVVTAAGAIALSLMATADGSTDARIVASLLLGVSGLILVVDVLIDDWHFARQPKDATSRTQ